jgi:hypothetical protein
MNLYNIHNTKWDYDFVVLANSESEAISLIDEECPNLVDFEIEQLDIDQACVVYRNIYP